MDDRAFMTRALEVAAAGMKSGEMPIGAVVVVDGDVVSEAHTQETSQRRLLVHAELLALDEVDRRLGLPRLRLTLMGRGGQAA
jgi:tRNA(adenine34) deaminase